MRNRGIFWLILSMAFLPLLLAMTSYFGGVWQPADRVNQGELLASGITLESLQLVDANGDIYKANGHWRLLLMVGSECQQECQQWRSRLVNLHAALGRDRDRLNYHEIKSKRHDLTDKILLADPLGNMVVSYRMNQSPGAVLDDLKRLLKVSKVG
ncbi:MAG: hypothetical protein V7731_24095 [Amphritea sp.]